MFERAKQLFTTTEVGPPGLLVVDDDPDLRLFVRTLLEQEELGTVYEAPDGETAIEVAYDKNPHLVILDYHMPRMNGEAVARILRLMTPGARIILLSAVLHEPVGWADAFVAKSDIDRLPEVVRTQSLLLIGG